MRAEFVNKYAPKLALRATGITGIKADGMQGPEEPPMQNGMPLPYFQEEGGPRQYFDGSGRGPITDLHSWTPMEDAGFNTPPMDSSGLPVVPPPTEGRRVGIHVPADPNWVPPNMGRRPETFSAGNTPRDMLRPQTSAPVTRSTIPEQPYFGPQETLRLPGQPPSHRIEDPRITDSETRQRETLTRRYGPDGLDPVRPQGTDMVPQFEGGLLGQLLDRLQMRIPMNDGLRGRNENVLGNPEVIDERANRGRVRRVSQGAVELPDFSTEEGLVDFNNRMGLRLNRQSRTQAEQDSLYNRGLTPTRNSAHITGRAFDWPGSQLGGRTGAEAVQYVHDRFEEVYGEDAANMYTFQWESGRGRHQGSGPHVHAEPK